MTPERDSVYLLDPRSAAVLDGTSRRPRHNFSSGDFHPVTGFFMTLAAGGAALFLLGLVLTILWFDLRFVQNGASAQATIADCIAGRSTTVLYQYMVDGSPYTQRETLNNRTTCDGMTPGSTIEIRYLLDAPYFSQFPGAAMYEGGALAMIAIVGLGLLLAAIYALYRTLRTRRQFARLEAQGTIVYGRIQEVQRGSRGVLIVHYFFNTADGKTLRGKAFPQNIKQLPQSGLPVAVLYADETCYRAL
ncbi:MAG: hypothetical protein U0694_04585 [Anaerolineae bacterium]